MNEYIRLSLIVLVVALFLAVLNITNKNKELNNELEELKLFVDTLVYENDALHLLDDERIIFCKEHISSEYKQVCRNFYKELR